MVYTLNTRRMASILALGLVFAASLALTRPALAQEPGGRFRVLIPNPEVQDGVRERFARDVADRVIFMDGGHITEQGPSAHVIDNPSHERTRSFLGRMAMEGA